MKMGWRRSWVAGWVGLSALSLAGVGALRGAPAPLEVRVQAPQFARALDVYQGFNFKKDKQTPVGFITSLTIGGAVLKPDLETVVDPEKPAEHIKAVAVLNHVLWETGVTDAIFFSGQISGANKQQVQAKVLTAKGTSPEVDFTFSVYEFDPIAKKYFKAFTSDQSLKGLIAKNGMENNVAVADEASREVQSPQNFTFQIGIKPQPTAQTLTIESGGGKKVVKAWGVGQK